MKCQENALVQKSLRFKAGLGRKTSGFVALF